MEKHEELKDYIQPKCRVIEIESEGIMIVTSPGSGTGGSIEEGGGIEED